MRLAVVIDGVPEGVVAEDGAVKFVFREVAEVVVDILGGDFESVVEGFPFGEFREGGGAGDGGGATVGFPTEVLDGVGFGVDLNEHFHLVATNGVANEADGIGGELFFVAH